MSMRTRTARLGFAAALFALLLGPLAFSAQSAFAQGPTVSNYWGGDQEAGATISAYIGGELCASTTVRDDGQWALKIDEGDCGGNAVDGAEITFDVNDDHAEPHVTFTPGDAQTVALEVHEDEHDDGMGDTDDGMEDPDDGMEDPDDGMEDPDDGMEDPDDGMEDPDDGMEDPDDGMEDPDDGMDSMTPGDKGDTGNAGFVTESGSTSAALVLALGVLALAGVAGARTVTGRVS